MTPSEILTAAADRVRDLAAQATPAWAAPRDATCFDQPNISQPKRWHVATADGRSHCYHVSLRREMATPPADVPEEQRCTHWGCKRLWPGASEPERRVCSVDTCERLTEGRKGLCKQHAANARRGKPLKPFGPIGPQVVPIEERFWAAVDKNGPLPSRPDIEGRCWIWTKSLDHGYGSIQEVGTRRGIRAHRLSWELHGGTLIDGLELDHLCRNRACVNPAHLEQVTGTINILRGEGAAAQNARKTHCKNGHPFAGDNLRITADGKRQCRECLRARQRARYRRVRDLSSPREQQP
jgi:hypothetical protein